MKNLVLVLLLSGTLAPCYAVDCTLVDDEFDELMNNTFLIQPEKYTAVQTRALSIQDYNNKQKGAFLLRRGRDGLGIAVIQTNRNTRGKILFSWGRPYKDGKPTLTIREAVLYAQVENGFRARKLTNLRVDASGHLDLDTGRIANNGAADIWFNNVNGREMYIEAVNGASLAFPVSSLCDPLRAHTVSTTDPTTLDSH